MKCSSSSSIIFFFNSLIYCLLLLSLNKELLLCFCLSSYTFFRFDILQYFTSSTRNSSIDSWSDRILGAELRFDKNFYSFWTWLLNIKFFGLDFNSWVIENYFISFLFFKCSNYYSEKLFRFWVSVNVFWFIYSWVWLNLPYLLFLSAILSILFKFL